MPWIDDDIPNAGEQPSQTLWAATVANSPGDFNELAQVVIPGIDPNLRWDDCRWQPRHNSRQILQRGDTCLVGIDDDNRVWIVCWWPYDS